MRLFYFAYGSNLKRSRLVERVPGARSAGIARLEDHLLTCDKRGADGSGKANLRVSRGDYVWGAVYQLPQGGLELLDAHERGYERVALRVDAGGTATPVASYLASHPERLTDDPVPLDWYRSLILEGATEHGLPADWIARLARLPSRPG